MLALEMLGASCYLFWSGIAAILVGIIIYIYPLSLVWQGSIFSLFTVGLVWLWWYRLYDRDQVHSTTLSQRAQQLIGIRTRLSEPIINNLGRLYIEGSIWRVQSNEDLPSGTLVEIYKVEGITLFIQRISTSYGKKKETGLYL